MQNLRLHLYRIGSKIFGSVALESGIFELKKGTKYIESLTKYLGCPLEILSNV